MEFALFINRDKAMAAGQSAIEANREVHTFREVFTRLGFNVGYIVEVYDVIGDYHHTITEGEIAHH